MNDLEALVKGVLADLDGAGALADWLQEHDREPEAKLLRRRWRLWQTQRRKALDPAERFADPEGEARLRDDLFREYVAARFQGVRVEDVPMWGVYRRLGHALASSEGSRGFSQTVCGTLGTGFEVSAERPTRICPRCLKALRTARLMPRGEAVPA